MRLRLITPLTAAIVIVLDVVSKYFVVSNLQLNELTFPIPFLRPLVGLIFIHNTGAAFGILPNMNLVFTAIAIVVVIVIIYYTRTNPAPDLWISFALGLLLGGALGNLIDRLRFGYVVDFLYVKFWAISNVADMCISLGVVILAVRLLLQSRQEATANASPQPAQSIAAPEDKSDSRKS